MMRNAPVIDVLVALGTPQRTDYTVNESKVWSYFNIYSTNDSVQELGAVGFVTAGGARRAPCGDNLDFSTDPWGGDVGHSDLHSPWVMNRLHTILLLRGQVYRTSSGKAVIRGSEITRRCDATPGWIGPHALGDGGSPYSGLWFGWYAEPTPWVTSTFRPLQ